EEVDYIVFATMTPDHYFPGCGGILQDKLGIGHVPALDIRQQCTGFIYGLQVSDALLKAGEARTLLLVGAEVHSGFMPWTAWDFLFGRGGEPPTEEEKAVVTGFRDRTVLFGDAAGAVVLRASDSERGLLGLPDDRVYNNIQKYGNTTAATIPIALDECRKSGRIRSGQLVCFVGLGAGFHWGAALMRA